MSTDPRPTPRDEELLAWILDSRTRERRGREELVGDAQVRERLEGLESFVESCRSELREEMPANPEGLAALERQVLARTTREDVSWRGDLRLVRGFLRQRLSSSVFLRVVAASLLVHVAALPVLAYYTWVAPKPSYTLLVDLARELPYGEPEHEPDSIPVAPETDLESLPTGTSAAELYHERLDKQGVGGLSSDQAPDMVVWTDELGLVLRCEQLLDARAARAGSDAEPLGQDLTFALSRLRRKLEELEGAADRRAWRGLAASAWIRARAQGAADEAPTLEARCDGWMREAGLTTDRPSAQPWLEAFRRAEVELDQR
jgi:hypothetical protein